MILKNASIKRKLEGIILITVAAVLLPCILLFMWLEIVSARDDSIDRLQSLADVLGSNSSAALAFQDKTVAKEVISSLSSQDDVVWAGIEQLNGEYFIEYPTNGIPREVTQEQSALLSLFSLFDMIKVREPILLDGSHVGDFIIIGDMTRLYNSLIQQVVIGLGIF
ncbi:MAG: CHASE sensor domain-containing protein, partial [Gammaproteobacteria bacterium]|nr:CHASE sensor domain-containing protein [Gammaproteobacteria bacterium]